MNLNANITLDSFRGLLGTVNDGDFILQQKDGATSLERVNRGQNAISRKIIYKQMDLSGAGEANYRTRVAFMQALLREKCGNSIPKNYIDYVSEQLGIVKKNGEGKMVGADPLECKPLSVRQVKELIDSAEADIARARQQETGHGRGGVRQDAREVDDDGYTVVNNGFRESGNVTNPDRSRVNVMVAKGKDDIRKEDEKPEEQEFDLENQNVRGEFEERMDGFLENEIGGSDVKGVKGNVQQQVIDENQAKLDNERIQARIKEQVNELNTEIKQLRDEIKKDFIARFSKDIDTFRQQLTDGKLVIRSFVEDEKDQEIPVDGITRTLLLESLKKDGVSYFSDIIDEWLSPENESDKFTSMSDGFGADIALQGGDGSDSQSNGSLDASEVANLKNELNHLRKYCQVSEGDEKKTSYVLPNENDAQYVLERIGQRLETLKLAVDTAVEKSKQSVLGSNGFAKVVNEAFGNAKVEKPCSEDFTANISWAYRNYERTENVRKTVESVRTEFENGFSSAKAAVFAEDPTLAQDLLKAYDTEAKKILDGVNVPVPRPNNRDITDYQDLQTLLNQVNGLPNRIRQNFAKRLEKAEKRAEARKEVLEKALINQRIGEMLNLYENRISKEKFERIREFRDKPNDEIRKLIDDAVTEQVERKNIGSSRLVTVFKNKLDAFVRELVKDDVDEGRKTLEKNRARFVAAIGQYMDPNNQTYRFNGLKEKTGLLTPDGLGRIKEAAIQYAFEQVKAQHPLIADLNGENREKVWGDLEGRFRETFKAAMTRAFSLVENFQDLLGDKRKPLDPIWKKAFNAKLFLWKDEEKVYNDAVAALREALAKSMVADESIDNRTKWLTRDDVLAKIKLQLPAMIESMKLAPKK